MARHFGGKFFCKMKPVDDEPHGNQTNEGAKDDGNSQEEGTDHRERHQWFVKPSKDPG